MVKKIERTFNVTVTVDGEAIPPGVPIRIGKGKGAIPPDQAARIEKVHGSYTGAPVTPVDTAELETSLANALARVEVVETENADLKKQVEELTGADGSSGDGGNKGGKDE